MYGWGANERLLGKAFKGQWDKLILATKFAVMRGPNGEFLGLNGKPDYIKQACEKSLQNLGIDTIDLYYMHRQDPKVEIEEIVGVMSVLVKQGKIKHLGICEANAEMIRRAHAVHPLAAVQNEYSLWSREPEQEVLDVCQELGITFVAYSPLGRGFLTGAIKSRADLETSDWRLTLPRFKDEAIKENLKFVEVVEQVANDKNVSKAQIALAWVLSQNDKIVAIPGTRNIHRLEENLGSFKVELTNTDLTTIQDSLPSQTIGNRY
jgi:aryl-alcohol dehydrogenase-like predicted oxidoreductase